MFNLEKNKMKLSIIAASLILVLSACDDGEDGSNGVDGIAGTNGVDGTNGTDGVNGLDGVDGTDGVDGVNGVDASAGRLTRIATVPTGAEVTGLFLTDDGDLFFNVQHPSDANVETNDINSVPFDNGTVGVLRGVNFNNLPEVLPDSPVPSTSLERETVISAIGEYQVLGQTNDTFGDLLPNGLGVINNIVDGTKVVESNNPDFNGYLATSDTEGYLFTNWESYPGGVSRLKLAKAASGEWSVTEAKMINFDNVAGTAANCFGSMSPWGTPLTSEEWIVRSAVDTTTDPSWNDPADTSTDGIEAMTAPDFPNPYRYGYTAEITNPTAAEPGVVKHYTIGRYEHENSVVMPDRRTVYSSQDDTGGVLFKFIADNPEDLSSGTLYGAKLVQDAGLTDPSVTGFDVTWVELASSNNATIEEWISEYDGINTDDYVDGETSYMSMADVEAWANGDATYPTVANGGSAVTAGQPMDDRAAFIESRQAARLKGATAEWRKLEGISINHDRAQEAVEGTDLITGETVKEAFMYIGIADLDNTLTDDEGDVQLSARVKDCGGVYRAKLEEGYDLARIEPVIMGSTYRSSLTGAERCDVDELSQPDNVIVMRDGRILIGEDGFQENNTLWMYDPK